MPLISEHDERGIIRNRDRAKQIRSFRKLRYGNITPTDIDAYIEYHNQYHIFIEIKYNHSGLPYGQKLAYERLIDDLATTGKKSICIIAQHQTDDTEKDIDCAEANVRLYRYNGKWWPNTNGLTLKQFLDSFINEGCPEGCPERTRQLEFKKEAEGG